MRRNPYDLGARSYTLTAHRGQPGAPVFRIRLLSFGDQLELQELVKGLDTGHAAAEMVAHQLDSCEGFTDSDQPMPFPRDGGVDARVAWVHRLLPAWVGELSTAISTEAELDPEEE